MTLEEIKEHDDKCEANKTKCLIKGLWNKEPNRLNWKAHGLDCMIIRNAGMLNLCGYVGVPLGHAAFSLGYDLLDPKVHGGLTYSSKCGGHICHITDDKDDEVWWLGFDCGHCDDLIPNSPTFSKSGTYRDIEYVKSEVENLAIQLNKENICQY